MNEIDKTNLNDQKKFRLNEINKIKDYFNSKIQKRKTMNKKHSKYIAAFDYIDKTLIVFSATSEGVSVICFCNFYWCSCRNSRSKFCSCIFFANRNNKKSLTNNKK